MKIEIHHYHHLGAETLDLFLQSKRQLNLILEGITKIMSKLENQEQQLNSVISEIKTGLSGLQTRVESVIQSLTAKNNETENVDLSDELSELQNISGNINSLFQSSSSESSETDTSDVSDVPPTTEESSSDTPTEG